MKRKLLTTTFLIPVVLLLACAYTVIDAARDVNDVAQSLAPILREKHPELADKITDRSQKVLDALERDDGQALPILADLITIFQDDVRPLVVGRDPLSLKAIAYDIALRKLARKLREEIAKHPVAGDVIASDMRAKGIPVDKNEKIIKDYLNSPKLEKPAK